MFSLFRFHDKLCHTVGDVSHPKWCPCGDFCNTHIMAWIFAIDEQKQPRNKRTEVTGTQKKCAWVQYFKAQPENSATLNNVWSNWNTFLHWTPKGNIVKAKGFLRWRRPTAKKEYVTVALAISVLVDLSHVWNRLNVLRWMFSWRQEKQNHLHIKKPVLMLFLCAKKHILM